MIRLSNMYSPKSQLFIRVIAVIIFLLLLSSNTVRLVSFRLNPVSAPELSDFITLIHNFICSVFMLILFFFPSRLGLLAIPAFTSAFISSYFFTRNTIDIFLFISGTAILNFRGYYHSHRKLKLIFTVIGFASMQLLQLQFGFEYFVSILIYNTGFLFTVMLIFFFIHNHLLELDDRKSSMGTLNIADYPDLQHRDAEWLKKIKEHCLYKEIASDYNLKEGTVRNRLQFIFNTLEVGDKKGFLNKYADTEIVFIVPEENA